MWISPGECCSIRWSGWWWSSRLTTSTPSSSSASGSWRRAFDARKWLDVASNAWPVTGFLKKQDYLKVNCCMSTLVLADVKVWLVLFQFILVLFDLCAIVSHLPYWFISVTIFELFNVSVWLHFELFNVSAALFNFSNYNGATFNYQYCFILASTMNPYFNFHIYFVFFCSFQYYFYVIKCLLLSLFLCANVVPTFLCLFFAFSLPSNLG